MKWGRQESQFSHWTIALSEHRYELLLGVVFLGHLILANFLPPAEDELYYWTWSQDLAWSYFDHPPMTAWWIWFSTLFFGNSLLAIRLPAILVHLFVLYQLGQLSETKSIVTLLLFTPLSLFGAIFMTPDIPLVFFWILYLNWASGINLDFSNWSDDPVSRVYHQRPVPFTNWILGGIWLGLGLLSKYTMALAPICLFFLLLTKYRIRAWSQGFFVHLLVSAVLFLPVLYFNVNHDFYPFLFQWNHIKNPVPLKFVYTFLGSQIALVGALPFLLLPWLALNYRSLGRLPAFRSLFFFFSIPMAFFVFKSTHHFLEANWAIVTYMSFWPMSSYFIRHNTFRALVRATLGISFSVPLVISGLLLIHLVHPLRFIGVSQDRLARFRGQNEMVKTLSETHSEQKKLPVFLPTYQWVSYFRYHGFPMAEQLPDLSRPSQFTLTRSDPCLHDPVLFFNRTGEAVPPAFKCFTKKSIVTEVPLLVRNETLSTWELIHFSKTEATK